MTSRKKGVLAAAGESCSSALAVVTGIATVLFLLLISCWPVVLVLLIAAACIKILLS